MAIVWLFAALYVHYQTIPQLQWLLYGIKPVIMAIVLQALWKLGRKAAKDIPTIIAGIAAIAAYFAGLNEILVLLLLGVALVTRTNHRPPFRRGWVSEQGVRLLYGLNSGILF